jgi:predicted RNase H-like HicB family nuclease
MVRFRRPEFTHPLVETDIVTVVLQWEEESKAWLVSVPRLKGVFTDGHTVTEALDMACEAIWCWLDAMRDLRLSTGLTPGETRRLRSLLEDHADAVVSRRRLREERRIPLETVLRESKARRAEAKAKRRSASAPLRPKKRASG